jgi:hypothetical protein
MTMSMIQKLLDDMEPAQAASEIALVMTKLWPVLDEDARIRFVMGLVGEAGQDTVTSLVHL